MWVCVLGKERLGRQSSEDFLAYLGEDYVQIALPLLLAEI